MGVTVPEIAGYGEFTEIGRGGYSRVYRARQYEFDRPVAIKVLDKPLKDSAAVDAFERECRTMGALWDHPNIVPVFASAFTSDDRPCIVMKLFHEGSYSQVLRSSGPLALEELLVVGVKIAGALAAAHEAQIVHGDVKPHNIFKSKFGEPALGDFGIATFTGAGGDRAPVGVSVHYAAPEAVDSEFGPKSDQYSLAATIYTLALGKRPFEASDVTESNSGADVLHRVITKPTPRLPKRFPKELRNIIWRGMSRDPGERYDGVSAFGAALSGIASVTGEDASARETHDGSSHSLPEARGPSGGEAAVRGTEAPDPPVRPQRLHGGGRAGRASWVKARVCAGCGRAHRPAATDCQGCGAELNHGTSEIRTVPQPQLGVVRLPGGRLEALDADLVIGRSPTRGPIEPHERALVVGEDDRTVSRRHVELRRQGWSLSALVRGNHTKLKRQAAVSTLEPGTIVELRLGDILYFGTDTWLRYLSSDHSGDTLTPDASRHGEVAAERQAGWVESDGAMSSGGIDAARSFESRVCRSCGHAHPTSAGVCGQCKRTLDARTSVVIRLPQPRLGTAHFSDGTSEALDADLVIGRLPDQQTLEARQRAVTCGSDDRSVSRRHIELRLNGWELTARCLGSRLLLERNGEHRVLSAGEEAQLESGDTLHFGASSWLRYDGNSP